MDANVKQLILAATVFNFAIPEWLDDDVVVGKICGVNVTADAVRKLSQSLDTVTDIDAQLVSMIRAGDVIAAIKQYRTYTYAGLKDAKDYVENLAVREGIFELRENAGFGSRYNWLGDQSWRNR